MSSRKNKMLKQVAFENNSEARAGEKFENVLHSKIPSLEDFITTIRESDIVEKYKSDYDRDGGFDRTYDRDGDHYDRGTFDRTT
ncbi:hypothetical protein GXP67_01050 [Rhodocytophaga rosea]|uniref:Uncharacterized protein n=1 Tax=Rhodocytophaga rosea TaxID=2704465 RepID=A0A6C0GCG0_9BACT|nr:hypothetical protein [Rhodocytophaga rosea]QHT65360.1 hypothetical protein GXP67_01050 [Rhodocytophaga rosea]